MNELMSERKLLKRKKERWKGMKVIWRQSWMKKTGARRTRRENDKSEIK